MIVNKLISFFKHFGYAINTRPYELNIVGLRSPIVRSNSFDDDIHVFFKNDKGHWEHYAWKATTDPGTYWLQNPMQPKGTGILAHGNYPKAYRLGMHRGKYLALVQTRPVTVIRDYDRNAVLDFYNGNEETGYFGINIHHAKSTGTTDKVDRYSAGCQVFADINDFDFFLRLCAKHQQLYGNAFDYTLIDLRQLQRTVLRNIFLGSGIGAIALIAWLVMWMISNEKKDKQQAIINN
jgi:hypothetical protein